MSISVLILIITLSWLFLNAQSKNWYTIVDEDKSQKFLGICVGLLPFLFYDSGTLNIILLESEIVPYDKVLGEKGCHRMWTLGNITYCSSPYFPIATITAPLIPLLWPVSRLFTEWTRFQVNKGRPDFIKVSCVMISILFHVIDLQFFLMALMSGVPGLVYNH